MSGRLFSLVMMISFRCGPRGREGEGAEGAAPPVTGTGHGQHGVRSTGAGRPLTGGRLRPVYSGLVQGQRKEIFISEKLAIKL